MIKPVIWILGLFAMLCSCEEDETRALSAEGSGQDDQRQVVKIDKHSAPGRVFMYLDDAGNVVRTSDYSQIPPLKQEAVMVIEGSKRARVVRSPRGKVRIQALPAKTTVEEKIGSKEAARLLAENPPESNIVSEESSDEQWRDEIKRELQELHKEQREKGK